MTESQNIADPAIVGSVCSHLLATKHVSFDSLALLRKRIVLADRPYRS